MTARRFGGIVVAAILLLLAASLPLRAQQDAESKPNEPTLEQLQAKLKQLQAELKREQAASKSQEQRQQQELQTLRTQRQEVAGKLLGGQLQREQNARELNKLRDRSQQIKADLDRLLEEAKAVPSSARQAAEQLQLHLQEVPGTQSARQQLREAASKLKWQDGKQPSPEILTALNQVLTQIDAAHADAMQVGVRRVELHTASGKKEAVKLLSLGHVRFAYLSDDGRVGLALSSPQAASGYRWSESLDAATQQSVRDAIAGIEAGTPGVVSIPIDPTGRMQPDSLQIDTSLGGQLQAGGMVMYPLIGLALIALALIAERAYVLYVRNPNTDRLAADVQRACEAWEFDRAVDLCQQTTGGVSRVLAACLSRRKLGQRAIEDSIQEQLLHELPRLQRFMGGIAILAAVAPLLGLLGTVTGIIRTFGVIRAFGNANPSLMAGGISEALLTTATGLMIAVPILIAHCVLRGRADRIIADSERHAASVLATLIHHDRNVPEVDHSDEPDADSEATQPSREGAVVD